MIVNNKIMNTINHQPQIPYQKTPYQSIPYQKIALANNQSITLTVKRIDQVHPKISGNKWYKLKYNLLDAKRLGCSQLLSFGGAYSNHIHALSHASRDYGFESIGIIRGEELANKPLNQTLADATSQGMQLEFVSRREYRLKHTPAYLSQLQARYPKAYIIFEGGTNKLAIKGCEEILSLEDRQNFDIIVCAVGTGGTLSGIINASHPNQQVIGFSALKGDFLTDEVQHWLDKTGDAKQPKNWTIYSEDKFGGYAKFNDTLLNFIDSFNQQYHVPLEPIYTGKAMFRLLELIENQQIKAGSRVLFVHTGGLQAFASLK